jgi:hypothetical protein
VLLNNSSRTGSRGWPRVVPVGFFAISHRSVHRLRHGVPACRRSTFSNACDAGRCWPRICGTGSTSRNFSGLKKVASAGFAQSTILDPAPTMISLKSRPEFAGVMESIRKNPKPCETNPAYKAFDFWLGEWDVQVAGQTIARSRIEKIDDGCIVQENRMPFAGRVGKSWNFFDASTGMWEQIWMSGGSLLRLQGQLTGGTMAYHGLTAQPNGHSIQERLTFTPLPAGRVHQFWEQSNDDGKTWTIAFDGIYLPHKEAEPAKDVSNH